MKAQAFTKLTFDRPVPVGHGAVSELAVGKLGVESIKRDGDAIEVRMGETVYYIPWSRVACAW